MSIRGTNGKDLDVSSEVVRVNSFYGNGTGRKSIRPSQPKDYGAKRSVASGQRYRPVGREAFRQIAPMRKPEPSYEAYKQPVAMEGVSMRGRVKSYYKDMGGGGQPEADMSEVAGVSAVQEASAQYYNAPEDYGVSSYVEVESEEPGPYVPYPQTAGYVEVRGEQPGYYKPYAQVGDMGQAYTGPQEVWRNALSDFSKDIQGFNIFTTNSQELRAYNKGMHVVATGRTAFAEHPQIQAGINAIEGELGRWARDRAWAITKKPGTKNQFGISKIRTRMINALNYARTAVSLSSVSTMPTVPEFTIPTGLKEEAPGAATPPGVVPMVIEEPTWFEKNKKMVVVGGVVALLGVGLYLYKKG